MDIDEKDDALDKKEDVQTAEDIKPSVNSKTKTSTEIAIQKASLMVRIAEHKAVPQSEQLRLLDMAVKKLVGIGFSAEDMTKLLPHSDNLKAEVISTAIPSNHRLPTIDIMSLPEVVGAVHEKKSVYIGSYEYVFYPAEVLAGIVKASVQDLNAFAVKYNLKTDYTGIWERVKTPSGEAREFLYFEGFPNLPNIVKLRNLKTLK